MDDLWDRELVCDEVARDDAFLDASLEAAGELRTHLRRVKDPDFLAEMRSGREALGFR